MVQTAIDAVSKQIFTCEDVKQHLKISQELGNAFEDLKFADDYVNLLKSLIDVTDHSAIYREDKILEECEQTFITFANQY